MPLLLLHPTVSFSLLSSSLPSPSDFTLSHFSVTLKEPPLNAASKSSISRPLTPALFCPASSTCRRRAFLQFCSKNEVSRAHVDTPQGEEIEELGGLIGRPTPCPKQTGSGFSVREDDEPPKPPKRDKDEALKPFLKFFRPRDPLEQQWDDDDDDYYNNSKSSVKKKKEEIKKVVVKYYDPKPGEFVIGVIVSGNENKLDVNIGADLLGTMLTKEVLPLYEKEMDYLLFDTETDAEEFMVNGKVGIVKDEDAISSSSSGLGPGRPILEPGTVLFAQVLGRTLSGRPLLSTRRLFRRIAWHRVRQIKQLNEPIEVRITEWNTGGLLTRIEGLRAFLPKNELVARVNNFTDLKENVGRRMHVLVTRIDDASNNLILSEKDAWEKLNLREGSVLKGTVRKIYPYGAQIRIDETNRSGLLHISNISRGRVTSVSDLLAVDEKVKVMVAKSMFPDKIALSIADLESEPGLFLSNKEKVYSEAEEMAKKYRQKLPAYSVNQEVVLTEDTLPFHDEENLYSNWKWFKFERGDDDDIKQ